MARMPHTMSQGLSGAPRPLLVASRGILFVESSGPDTFLATMTPDPIPGRALGSVATHGDSWIVGRTGHYVLKGFGTLQPWEDLAACKDAPLEWFFGDETPLGTKSRGRTKRQTAQAKEICTSCPVIEECRRWALESRVPFGVLGGMTERERLEAIEGKPVGPGTRYIRPL